MTDVVESVRAYLLADPTVSAIVSQRIYLDEITQNRPKPAVVLSKDSESHTHNISDRDGMVETRFEVQCLAMTRLKAEELARAIYKSGICAKRGDVFGTDFRAVRIEDGRRNFEIRDARGGDKPTRGTRFDLTVTYKEPANV